MLGSLGWRGKAMEFKGNRINPLNGIKRIFGLQGVIELVKSIAKVLLLGTIGYLLIARSLPAIMTMASRDRKHTSELQSLMRHSFAVLCWKKQKKKQHNDR